MRVSVSFSVKGVGQRSPLCRGNTIDHAAVWAAAVWLCPGWQLPPYTELVRTKASRNRSAIPCMSICGWCRFRRMCRSGSVPPPPLS